MSSKEFWVFLDAGDTFVYGYPTLYEALQDCWRQRGFEIERERIQQVVQHCRAELPTPDFGSQAGFQAHFQSLYRCVLHTLAYPGDLEEGVAYVWDEWRLGRRLRLFDDALAALRMWRNAGYRLGVVSNWDASFQHVLTRLGVWDMFDVRIASCAVGVAKPDEAIFRLALREANAQAEECWFIGDQLAVDILPATALGMRTVLVDYYGYATPDEAQQADLFTPSLSLAATRVIQEGVVRETRVIVKQG